MTTTNDDLMKNKPICEECGEERAIWAVCFDIVKQYPIDDDGDPIWGSGAVIQNENDPILMCGQCAHEHEA